MPDIPGREEFVRAHDELLHVAAWYNEVHECRRRGFYVANGGAEPPAIRLQSHAHPGR